MLSYKRHSGRAQTFSKSGLMSWQLENLVSTSTKIKCINTKKISWLAWHMTTRKFSPHLKENAMPHHNKDQFLGLILLLQPENSLPTSKNTQHSSLQRSIRWSDVMATKTFISCVKGSTCHNSKDQLVSNIVSRKCSDVKWLLKLSNLHEKLNCLTIFHKIPEHYFHKNLLRCSRVATCVQMDGWTQKFIWCSAAIQICLKGDLLSTRLLY